MVTIFDGFARLSDEELRGQIAILSCVTFSNTIKGIWQSKSTRRQIEDCYHRLGNVEREQLDAMLRQDLINKCKSLGGHNFDEKTTDEELHFAVLSEASKVYLVDESKTPATRMDEIHEKYYNHYLGVLQKRLGRLDEKERVRVENQIQKEIAKRDINQMRQLSSEFMLSEFNGKKVLAAIVAAKNTAKLKRMIDVCGMGMFDGIDGVVSTAYDSVLSLYRLERALLAQAVWMAVNGYGGKTRLNDDLMPSFSSGFLQEENEKEKNLLILISREAQLNKMLRVILGDIDKNNKKLEVKEEAYRRDAQKLDDLKKEYGELKAERDKLVSEGQEVKARYEQFLKEHPIKINQDPRFYRLKTDYETLARTIRNFDMELLDNEKKTQKLESSLETQERLLTAIRDNTKELRESLVSHANEFNDVIMELENEAAYLSQVLERKWAKFYPILTFEPKVFETVVKQFTQRETVAIERMLKEFEECSIKKAFVQGNGDWITCLVAGGKYAKIRFKENHILEIQVKDRK
ncbi:MAG: hypothetical protein NC086_06655 [Alistipes sp.]|nr:hypothetical protein [Alistipes sp.]